MRCGYIDWEGEKVWIPGCEAGAIYGEGHCTCYKSILKGKKAEQTIENLEEECRHLRRINSQLNKKNQQLFVENNNLCRQGLPLKIQRILAGDKLRLKFFLERLAEEWRQEHSLPLTGPRITEKPGFRKK